jgi:hypothetical protein
MQIESVETRAGTDLGGAIQNRLDDFLSLVEVPVDVFHLHCGVVHQNADGKGQAAERHDVNRLAERA